jgi:hypothetical protein
MEKDSSTSMMPNSIADFESDPRIHFNIVSGKWEIEDDDGNEMEWDAIKSAWIPLVRFKPNCVFAILTSL